MAQQLNQAGFTAFALEGGFDAWKELYPVTPRADSELRMVSD